MFNISDNLSSAWEMAKKHGLMLAVYLFAIGIVNSIISNLLGPSFGAREQFQRYLEKLSTHSNDIDYQELLQQFANYNNNSVGTYISSIVSSILTIGVISVCIKLVKGELQSVDFKGFNLPFKVYAKAFLVDMIFGVIVMIGCFLCFIPGLYFGARLSMAQLYCIDNPEASIGDCLKASWNMTSDNVMSLIGLPIIWFFAAIAGFLCCCIGVYFAEAFIYLSYALAYVVLYQNFLPKNQ